MGFNLNKLKKQYGVGSASKLNYAGATNPGETFAYNADAKNAADEAITEAAQLEAYNQQKANYATDQASYDDYAAQYDQRMQGTPMYANKQFAGSKRVAPNTVNEMYEKYLGRENENNNRVYPAALGYGPTPEERQRLYDDENQQVTDAQRNQFIRDSNTELAGRGIDNTGNQYMMNQMGNYYGNVLGAPTSTDNVYGYGGAPIDGVPIVDDDTDNDTWVDPVINDGSVINDGLTVTDGDGEQVTITIDDIVLADNGTISVPGTTVNGPIQFPGTSTPVSGNTVNSDGTIVDANGVPIYHDYSVTSDSGGGSGSISDLINNDTFVVTDDSNLNTGDDVVTSTVEDMAYDNGLFNTDYESVDFGIDSFFRHGGAVKGYAAGDLASNPGHRFVQNPVDFVEEEELDVTLTGDPLNMDVMIQEAAAPSRSDSMQEMLTMLKNNQGTSYDAGIASSQDLYNQSASDFQSLIEDMATNQSKGPSESEKWFRIAAALGKPTKTGNFFEGLGNVNEALADVASERREAGTQGDALRLQSAQFGMGLLQEQLESDKTLAAGERQRNERLQEMFIDWERESQTLTDQRAYDLLSLQEQRDYDAELKRETPQSEAGLIALEMGFEVGTDEYTKQITDWYDREEVRKDLEVKSLTMQANMLTNKEIDLKAKTDADILSQGAAIGLLEEALMLNELSYTDSFADKIAKGIAGLTNADSEKYMNTEKLMNVLSKGALMTLKATFGGNISDGERAANLDLQGTSSKSLEARRDIIQQALDTMRELNEETRTKLTLISSGSYSRRSAAK